MSSKFRKQIERYKIPATVDGICAMVRQILEGGHVGRMELDNDEAYVRAWRYVEKQDLEEPDINWEGAVRNIDSFMEYSSEGASSFQVLVDMTILADSKGCKPDAWIIGYGGKALLEKWLLLIERGMPSTQFNTLLGIQVIELKSIPEETLMLCCSDVPNAEPSEITLVIKTTIDMRGNYVEDSIEDGRADGRVGDHSEEHLTATHQLALNPGALCRVPWKARSQAEQQT